MSLLRASLAIGLGLSSVQAADVIVRLERPLAAKATLPGFTGAELLVPDMNIYLLRDASKSATDAQSLRKAFRTRGVKGAMANSKLSWRAVTPNDPAFVQQWGPTKIGAPAAWALGTGGQNSDRDDIVVAVVDGGVDVAHEDLKANIWTNTAEIAGNSIDDDGNGYVDDVYGWNGYNNTGAIRKDMHGTHVAGIIGAEGGNGKHIAGLNWDLKIMTVSASSGDTAIVLRGYGYVLAQKKLWLSSGGAKGANVVATNSSFGVDGANCSDTNFKLWNDIYEEMGKAGILSAAATANQAWDIDRTGDVPTSCVSEYVVAVTNTTKDDKLFRSAGWGKTHVDLGAPGTDVYSTVTDNAARNLTGTSMATPHVAGAVGFLYSVGSSRFTALSKSDPAKAALAVKAALLSTVDPLDDLKDRTVTGGRLNLAKAATSLSRY